MSPQATSVSQICPFVATELSHSGDSAPQAPTHPVSPPLQGIILHRGCLCSKRIRRETCKRTGHGEILRDWGSLRLRVGELMDCLHFSPKLLRHPPLSCSPPRSLTAMGCTNSCLALLLPVRSGPEIGKTGEARRRERMGYLFPQQFPVRLRGGQ